MRARSPNLLKDDCAGGRDIVVKVEPRTRSPAPPTEVPEDDWTKEAASTSRSGTGDPWPIVLLVGWIAVLVLLKAAQPFDTDGWWHIRTGELILDQRAIPTHDAYSWTMHGKPWQLNSWLYDLVVGMANRLAGRGLVSALTMIAFVALGVISYRLCRRAGARPWPSLAASVPVIFLFGPFIFERPQVISYLLFAAVLVLAPPALSGSNRALAALCAAVAFWSNLHLAFSIGVLLTGLFAAGTIVNDHRVKRAITVVGIVAASGLANPYGFNAYASAFKVRRASQIIVEWQHANPGEVRDIVLLGLAALALAALWRTGRWRRLDHVLPVIVLTALTADAIRNGPYLLLAIAPELALGASTLTLPRVRAWFRVRRTPLLHGAILGLIILAFAALGSLKNPRGPQPATFPVRATKAIPAGCRLLNEYDQGGYIIQQRWPQVLVSQDGRNDLYGESRLVDQLHVLRGDAKAIQWLDQQQVDCVLARPSRPIIKQLVAADWRRLASDQSGILMVRTNTQRAG
jgi:hypothetical protein